MKRHLQEPWLLSETSGWMAEENFVKVTNHFINHTAASNENPALLIFDNHKCHLTLAALNDAKANGVTILTIPPHTNFKRLTYHTMDLLREVCYSNAVNSLLLRKQFSLTIYNVAKCVNIAFQRALTPVNISSGFKKTGIFPFDRNILSYGGFCQVKSLIVHFLMTLQNQALLVRRKMSQSKIKLHLKSQPLFKLRKEVTALMANFS